MTKAKANAKVISMRTKAEVQEPWALLGFESERDMLLDDLRALEKRLKSADTPAHTVAALSKRKYEVLDHIKALDSGDDPDDILDDAEDEAFTPGG